MIDAPKTEFGASTLMKDPSAVSWAAVLAGGVTGAAQGAGQAAAQSTEGAGAAIAYFADMLLRPPPGGQVTATGQAGHGADLAAVRGEIGRIFARGLSEGGELPAADRTYLTQ